MKNTHVSARVLWALALVVVLLFTAVSIAFALDNRISNGNFSSDLSSWSQQPDMDPGVWVNTGNPSGSGSGSARMDALSGGSGYSGIFQCLTIPVTMTGIYLSGYIDAGINADASIGVYEYTDTGCGVGNENPPGNTNPVIDLHVSAPSGWTHVQTDIGSGAGIALDGNTTSVKILLSVYDPVGDGATAWFDDVTTSPAGPNAVTLNSFDAKQSVEPSLVWPLLVALPLALGAVTLMLRRRRA